MSIDATKIFPIICDAARLLSDKDKVNHIESKGYANYVTETDKAVQQKIRMSLKELYPSVQFVSEEKENEEVDLSGDFWILDPVDGTMNLMRDFAHSAISLGYAEKGELIQGIIYDPYRDEMFYGRRNNGAFLLKDAHNIITKESEMIEPGKGPWEKIHVSDRITLSDSIAMVGTSPYMRKELGKKYMETISQVFFGCQDIRRFAASVLDFAWIACGRAEVFFEHIYPWDRAAGIVIVKEAGGKVCSFDGGEVPIMGFHDVIAGVPEVVDEVVQITSSVFNEK